MPNFNVKSEFLASAASNKINVEKLLNKIDDQPELIDDFKKVLVKKGISSQDIFLGEKIFTGPFKTLPGIPPPPPVQIPPTLPPIQIPPTPEQTQPVFEIDTTLQLLISSIPIANPGNIITSEYHNALRDAVRALASRMGLSVNPTAEFKILTFSPNFLPTIKKDSTEINLKWDVTLKRAVIPEVGANDLNNQVSGGFIVQLPDNATIFQMIARGSRLGTTAPNPKDFHITLKRMKFGKDQQPQSLISLDLKAVKDGVFETKDSVKLSDADLVSINDNPLIASATISERKTVSNDAWMYFVTAEWTAGVENAAKFEINSIQILCTN